MITNEQDKFIGLLLFVPNDSVQVGINRFVVENIAIRVITQKYDKIIGIGISFLPNGFPVQVAYGQNIRKAEIRP